ncbi:MAG: hypothetical protein ACOVNU_11670 [Candidatus Kapaibacteriota bacterium]
MNIHLLPTVKESRLYKSKLKNEIYLHPRAIPKEFYIEYAIGQNIYIASDEEIKEGNWGFDGLHIFKCLKPFIANETTSGKNIPCFYIELYGNSNTFHETSYIKKIILTTDQDLIEDGVQAINDEFLNWFVKNPTCEEVKIESWQTKGEWDLDYKIIIPKEDEEIIDLFVDEEFSHIGVNPIKFENYLKVHFNHCYQGEYEDGCKYGEDDCPAQPLKPKKVSEMILLVNNVTMSCTSKPKQETHICKYCKAETTQSDDECYAKPQQTVEEAALKLFPKYISDPYNPNEDLNKEERNIWIDGAKSDTAREYWYDKLKQEIS